MIDFLTIQVGDQVRVIGDGAPGFAYLGEILTIMKVMPDRVYAVKANGEEAFFALESGAARLERIEAQPMMTHAQADELLSSREIIRRLEARVVQLEEEVDQNAWRVSPAMAQATIDQLLKQNDLLEAALTEIQGIVSELMLTVAEVMKSNTRTTGGRDGIQ